MVRKRSLKPLWITLIVIASLVLATVVLGVLNATVGKGKWQIGWVSYHYNDDGYRIGEGTLFDGTVTGIDMDWIEGKVEILVTDDANASISESGSKELNESEQLRWKLESDGTLKVKFRKSGSYLAGTVSKKDVILRIPQKMLADMNVVNVKNISQETVLRNLSARQIGITSVSGKIRLDNCTADRLDLTTVSGNMAVTGRFSDTVNVKSTSSSLAFQPTVCPKNLNISCVSGNQQLILPSDSSFTLEYRSVSGSLTSEFPLSSNGKIHVCGDGTNQFAVKTTSGSLSVKRQEG